MRIPPDRLLAGVARTLLEEVLPEVGARRARGQLYACVDVLRNLERRVEPVREPREAETRAIEETLRAGARQLRANGEAARAEAIESALAAWPAAPLGDRVAAARATLGGLLESLGDVQPVARDALEPLLGGCLAAQAVRELSLLASGSLLEEISRG
jgi:hypothetical protein